MIHKINPKVAFSKHQSSVAPKEKQADKAGVKHDGTASVNHDGKSYKVYPWKYNGNTPEYYIELYRSNGDIMNLVQTKIDFLFGAGSRWFEHRYDSDGSLLLIPYSNAATEEYEAACDANMVVDAAGTYLIESGNAFFNVSIEGGLPLLSVKDSLIVRAEQATAGKVGTWLLCPDWPNYQSVKNIVPVKAWTPETNQRETILQVKRFQSGQFYYGFPQYWAAAEWIKLANRIAKFHNTGLDTEYNVSRICRFATDYIKKFGGETEQEQDAFRNEFYDQIDNLLFSADGGNRVIFDECEIGPDGKMIPFVEFEKIDRQVTGKEYTDLYLTAVNAFANAANLLPGLSGVSDGKMLGGSGSELRVSAEYQQFYRTPRDRQLILWPFNNIVKKALKLPSNVYRGFSSILLESLDKNKAGASTQNTSTP